MEASLYVCLVKQMKNLQHRLEEDNQSSKRYGEFNLRSDVLKACRQVTMAIIYLLLGRVKCRYSKHYMYPFKSNAS
jgi:hypothetical protein